MRLGPTRPQMMYAACPELLMIADNGNRYGSGWKTFKTSIPEQKAFKKVGYDYPIHE